MFFVTSDHIPEGLGFKTFDFTHILWLLAGLLLWVGACIFYRKLSEKKRKTVLTVLGVYIFLQEMVKNLVVYLLGEFSWGYLPFHLCGINILLIAFDVFKPTKVVRSFLYYFAIPGALLALLFPNWTEMPVWNFFHLHSFTIHILLITYPVMVTVGGDIRPDWRQLPKCILFTLCMAVPIYLFNMAFGTNFMFLMYAEEGNPLLIFENLFGNHLIGIPVLAAAVLAVMFGSMTVWQRCRARKRRTA